MPDSHIIVMEVGGLVSKTKEMESSYTHSRQREHAIPLRSLSKEICESMYAKQRQISLYHCTNYQ